MISGVVKHSRIVGALLMREITTRFGREGLGFGWLVFEPLAFCVGVLILWTATKPAYEHGLRLAPFVMTGYMSIILIRHQVSYSMGAVQGNVGLLHHRLVAPIHLLLSRNLLELGGATIAFIIVYVALMALGQVSPPHDYLLLYMGWALLAWIGMGFGLTLTGLAMRFDVIERIVPVTTYILVPLSGAFFMVDWIPQNFRETFLLLPFAHPIEMIRAGVFGEFVKTYYHPWYAAFVGAGMNLTGLLLISSARSMIDVE